ncbi:expressed protein [Batrachochytrium dendrobatidis JAM81]|uniref:Expressed protein n=1 Tax=Batrachochytrium dendrobatidis (strain JAM81 / FGSC 10211) TaxID=684364 RepID=F4PDU3_BATDJ|nr:uncharacterized protein BATDEDRAFT_37542 [Batrachochytrium dendrobatidis JAM81]EGF76456.1 expressed protein [Batrachochytrium dendrobatidis JAM81]|eukprot:XP_006682870.1 expressed protein [Batrachochytrium dendrobatidis JAM81]
MIDFWTAMSDGVCADGFLLLDLPELVPIELVSSAQICSPFPNPLFPVVLGSLSAFDFFNADRSIVPGVWLVTSRSARIDTDPVIIELPFVLVVLDREGFVVDPKCLFPGTGWTTPLTVSERWTVFDFSTSAVCRIFCPVSNHHVEWLICLAV